MRALWIEDHALIGDSLETLLQVVMPEVSLDKARNLRSAKALALQIPYDLILLDWWLGTESGEAAIDDLRRVGCHAPFVVVSGDDRDVVKHRAMAVGASAFISKVASPQVLVDAIRSALAGELVAGNLPPASALEPAPRRQGANLGAVFPELTERQVEVFQQLTLGLSDKQIARNLGVASTTVRTHVRAILEIVGVHSRGEAAHQAQVRGAGAV